MAMYPAMVCTRFTRKERGLQSRSMNGLYKKEIGKGGAASQHALNMNKGRGYLLGNTNSLATHVFLSAAVKENKKTVIVEGAS
jgi:hypothetical protein